MVGIDMIREWHGEANNYILACMDIRHDANERTLTHRLIAKLDDLRYGDIFHAVRAIDCS